MFSERSWHIRRNQIRPRWWTRPRSPVPVFDRPGDNRTGESTTWSFNPLNAELNPICHMLALLGAHHILHVSRIRVNNISGSTRPVERPRTLRPSSRACMHSDLQLIVIRLLLSSWCTVVVNVDVTGCTGFIE